ncbi:hypothetical protein G6F57_003454 [Rhizopus arrhizus]|nr:hypothetical protein G6F21_002249 [Rhizopus arrhizus]KAG0814948.1 hypothetical protein G6F20_004378 [Rhizopus arrhizus]KAG0838406.1 hypothetical protein G6F19_003156 [Rhizopus arrhizus]KAG0841852.1 hypothetical protein G6F18_003035 [Rhizopus arrhizus]KAG0858146.1 hypothetical protein G6F17_003073 [Rhizopus arrhizus]
MFLTKLVTAGVATLYIIEVVLLAIPTLGAYNIPNINRYFTEQPFRKYLAYYELVISQTAEQSHHLVLLKLFLIQAVKIFGGFNYTLSWIAYFIDVATIFGLLGHFYEMLKEKELAETTIKLIDRQNSKKLQSFMSLELFKSLINPFWKPMDITIHPHITYATSEELKEALDSTNQDFDQPRKLMLDVITNNRKSAGLRPVLIHVHGGAWRAGKKDIFYPYEKLLVSEDDWVIVNIGYRLSPKNAYPTHLIDVKRAIRWTKQNISSFGGNPDFIVLSGDSAGGHLAAMASLTANDPQYQPGFEDVDTSFRAVISVNGALDVASDHHHASYFSLSVANLSKVDMEFLHQHSPASLAKHVDTLVPFLCLAGERDNLVEIDMAKNFKKSYDQGRNPSSCTLVVFPAGHHVSYVTWSPRSLYAGRIIQAWCRQLYKNKLN